MVGISVVSPSTSAHLAQTLLFDEVSIQSICSFLNVLTESVAEGSLCAAVSSLGILFLGLLETGELTIPDSFTRKTAALTSAQYGVQQEEGTWRLGQAFEVYSKSLPDSMDKKETPFSVQAFARPLPIPMVEGSLLTNYKYEDERATGLLLRSLRDCSKCACKLLKSEKEITKLLSNASANLNLIERVKSRKRKTGQWSLVAATKNDDDEDEDDEDEDDDEDDEEEPEHESDPVEPDDDDNDDEEGQGDGGDEGEEDEEDEDEGDEDEPEEEDEDNNDDDDENNNEDDEEDDEEEEEPPKKKRK